MEQSCRPNGSNAIPDSEPTTFWAEFKETFGDPMIKILLAIAAIMIIMFAFGYSDIYEPVGTIVAVLIVAVVSAKTGVASDTKYRQLKDSTKKDQCKVYRNGLVTVIDVDDVVVGDKVLLQSGDKVPADGVLIHGTLRVDNSALNGEAEECPKTAADESNGTPAEYYSVYATLFLGKDAYGMIDPEGGNMEMIIKDKGQVGGPLNQFSTLGYKFSSAAKILYEDRMVRVESCGAYSAEDEAN